MSHRQSIQFDDVAGFREEYERNIANGGAFIATSAEFELREIIEVDLELRFCGERISLEAEVVHAAPGGIAVQFLQEAAEIRARFAPLLGGKAAAASSVRAAPAPEPVPAVAEVPPARVAADAGLGDSEYLDADEGALELDLSSSDGGYEIGTPDERAIDLGEAGHEETVIEIGTAEDDGAFEIGGAEGADGAFDASALELDPDEISSEDLESVLGDDAPIAEPTLDPVSADASTGAGVPEVLAELTDPAMRIAMDPPAPPATEAANRDAGEGADPLDGLVDRREAPRAAARVNARVVTPSGDLQGRTRDLSRTGVLISADGNELPVGRRVRLELQRPDSGDALEVEGTVSRHVEAEGTVAAVGVSFEKPREDIAAFVEEVKRTEARHVESGITGVIQELGMANLIQMLGQSSPVGTLTATHEEEEGVVAFEHGRMRYALLGSLTGSKALARMLSWTEGAFEFRAHVDAITDEGEPVSLEAAILDAVRQLDEAQHTQAPSFGAGQTFRIDRKALASQSGLPKVEEAVLDLATAGFTVRRILDVIPESDAQVLEALASLAEAGILEAVDE